MSHHDHRTVAWRCQGAGCLVVSDHVLRKTGGAEAREQRLSHTLQRIENRCDECENKPDDSQSATDAHEHGAEKYQDAHHRYSELVARRRGELLHLGLKSMVAENLGDVFRSKTFLFTACRCDTCVLQQVVKIFLGVSHRCSTSNARIKARHGSPQSPYMFESIPFSC